ncbi:MAG TPA: ABC-F family ATP-binding cassette domain-containing protein [Ktedonobacterales bacterium]|nr:ABC-F family ATP-binding cassette domain-containing protein [Ktedonobacterales bacterium]
MSIVVVSDLTKSYGAELIFSRVSFRVEAHDRVGLVGPNGAGKSTLLNLLAGRLDPESGAIAYERGVTLGYLTQSADFHPDHTLYDEMLTVFAQVHDWHAELDELAARMSDSALLESPDEYAAILERYGEVQARIEHAGGYTTDQRVRQVLDGLGFSREQQAAPAAHLSGGQQTRAALGKLLLQEPELLLMDEPTNHLDLAALEWLEEYLMSWRGAVIVVSHDRYFLDRVTTKTIEIAHHRGEEYPGNYTKYVELREERLARWRKEYEAQQEYIARTEEFVRRYKAGQRSKEARGRQTLLDRMERIERPPTEQDLRFKLGANIQSGATVLATEKLVVGYAGNGGSAGSDGERVGAGLRVAVADTEILRGDRVGLLGPNGGGKTTLLRAIIGQLKPLEGRLTLGHNVQVGYYAQTHEGLNPRLTMLDEIRQQTHLSEEGARSYLGRFLFSGDDVFKPISALSGGERSRVALAKLTLQGANFLVLDEPTNHLDLLARQALEAILASYDGTLIFVSHDRYFLDALATKLWVLEDGVISAHVGNYTTYRTRQAQAQFAAQAQAARESAAARAASGPAGQTQRGEAQSARRGVDAIESEIVRGEERLGQIEGELAEASARADVERIVELGAEYEREKARIEALYEEWQGMAS